MNAEPKKKFNPTGIIIFFGLIVALCWAVGSSNHSTDSIVATTNVTQPITNYSCELTPYAKTLDTPNIYLSASERQIALITLGYDLGPAGADGVWGEKTEAAARAFAAKSLTNDDGCKILNAIAEHRLSAQTSAQPTINYGYPNNSTYAPTSGDWAKTCPNGSCYGQPGISGPRTDFVQGYDRKDGTHVGGYYRGHK